jgi:hypothetical protein
MSSIREAADRAHAACCAARAQLLEAVAELASSEAWRGDGAGNLAAWLSARWQVSLRTAAELVREAQAMDSRPALREALASGAVSLDQARALQVLCDQGTDDEVAWLESLPFWSIGELEREARKKKAAELERRDGGVWFRMSHTPDERYVRGDFQLHPEDGALLLAAVDARVPHGTPLREWDRASARALVELAKGSEAPRPTLMVTVDAAALDGSGAAAAGPGFVGAETARRLACDASVQLLYREEDGRITGIGRRSPTVAAWMRRAVVVRDGEVCSFPGCGRTRYLECHHIVPVSKGGETVLDNLVLVCWEHHSLVHEGGWSLRGPGGPGLGWLRPGGEPFEPRVRVVLDTS